jgi:hypothetical protein
LPSLITDGLLVEIEGGWSSGLKRGNKLKAVQLDATGAINGFIEDGLFIGQPKELLQFLLNLAAEADEARRES